MTFAHFPGSLPLSGAAEVFEWAGRTLGDRVARVPDGETTPLRKGWQPHLPWFAANPTLERGDDYDFYGEWLPMYHVKPGATPAFDASFEFADWARESYAAFKRVRDAGGLPAKTRFQVSFPHSYDAVYGSTFPDSASAVYDAFIVQMQASVEAIAASIPPEDLAVQWDIPTATLIWMDRDGTDQRPFMLGELVRHGEWVPEGVELGYHLCFGDGANPDHVAGAEPAEDPSASSASGLTELANDIVRAMDRRVEFLHFPTYGNWLQQAHYEPLQGLDVDGADISVGVINMRRDREVAEGVEHTRVRAASARAAIGSTFGISSACGLGRYNAEQFAAATDLYRELQD